MAKELASLHPEATGFTLLRVLPNGGCRFYSAVEFDHGREGAARFLHRLRGLGFVKNGNCAPAGWHVLDVLNADGDIVQDYAVPPHPSPAFRYIKRQLKLTVERVDDVR